MELEEKPERKLFELFDEGFNGLDAVLNSKEASNSSEVQVQVRHAITALEDCTRLVSATGMFSRNESLDEVSSKDIRYILLPALLGRLSLQISSDASGRLAIVLLAEAYFKDFLRRCRDYGVVDHEQVTALIDEPLESSENGSALVKAAESRTADIAAMVNKRNDKIQRLRAQKELEQRLGELKEGAAREGAEDEVIREYHTTLLKMNVSQAIEELGSLSMEKGILQHMARIKRSNAEDDDIPDEQRPPSRRRPSSSRPLKPVIITRDEVMKQVYGAGYPSLPVMTVAEFYEQRVKEGIFPGGCSSRGSHEATGGPVSEETETEEKEKRIEEDDPEELARQRGMDEYKDDHRRGEGNRYNRS